MATTLTKDERRFFLPRRDFGVGEDGDRRYANNVLLLVSLGTITTALSGGLLNISLPVLVRHFDANSLEASWLLLGAMLASTSTIIMFGRLADMLGRLPFYFAGMAIMTITSLLAGFSPNILVLIVLRMMQSVGSAMLLANLAAIIAVTFPADRLTKVMGMYMSALSAATLAGPPVGSLIADTIGWEWLFWSQVPLGAFCLIWGAMTFRPMPPTGAKARLDVPGVALVMVILTAILIALSQLQKTSLTSPIVLIGFGVFLAALPFFIFIELHTTAPLVDLRLFRRTTVAASNSAMFFGNMARFSIILLFGLYFQAVEGDTTLVAALKVLPLPISATIAGLCMGTVSKWGSDRAIATCSAAFSGFGTLLLLLSFSIGSPLWAVWGSMIIIGLGGGVFMPANTTAILQEVPREQLGVVNAVRMMLMSSGSLVATALSLAIVTSALPSGLRNTLFRGSVSQVDATAVHDLNSGYQRALLVLLLLNVVGVISAYISQRAARGPSIIPPPPGTPAGPIGAPAQESIPDAETEPIAVGHAAVGFPVPPPSANGHAPDLAAAGGAAASNGHAPGLAAASGTAASNGEPSDLAVSNGSASPNGSASANGSASPDGLAGVNGASPAGRHAAPDEADEPTPAIAGGRHRRSAD